MRVRMWLGLAAAAALVACGDGYGTYDGGGGGGSTGNDSVRVVNDAFNPITVTADSTGTVVWTWSSGGTTHNVTFQDAITGSGDKTTGTFTHTFVAPGEYKFRCTHHSSNFTSGMHGTVVVQ